MPPTPRITIRRATPDDVELVVRLIHALAVYERLEHECRATPVALREHLFGPHPAAECLIGELDGVPRGFALFFTSFSTFVCKPGLWLEDLFVEPGARGTGLGKALLVELARLGVERGAGRLEWNVLDWNEPALRFYRSLDGRSMTDWTTMRLDGDALARLAGAG